MLRFGRISRFNHAIEYCHGANLSTCCPPPKKPSGCAPGKPIGKFIPPPPPKGGCKQRVAPNPCVPRFHEGKDTWKKYRALAVFVCLPLILVQAMRAFSHDIPHKEPCRDYEYMRIRTKKYPWGTGQESFFHNDHVNHLPGECEAPPIDCD